MQQIKQDIEQLYKNSGYSADDARKFVKTLHHSGYDESFDGSLTVVYFHEFIVIVSCSGVSFVDTKELTT